MTAPDTRRFPITLRALTVTAIEDLNPRMRRITLGGAQIGAFDAGGVAQPALQSLGPDDHVKLFFAAPETGSAKGHHPTSRFLSPPRTWR